MLLEFTVENFRSYRDETTLSLVPAEGLRTHKEHFLEDSAGKKTRALPMAVLYGANASGKSNLVRAMEFAVNQIREPVRPGEPVPIDPFFSPAPGKAPSSRFEFVFKHEGVLWQYGFVLDRECVLEEWLFQTRARSESPVFERVTKSGKTKVEPGPSLLSGKGGGKARDYIGFVAKGTPVNRLFLSEAFERNVDAVKPVFEWFLRNIEIIHPHSRHRSLVRDAYEHPELRERLGVLLSGTDTGISDIQFDVSPFDPSSPDNPLRWFNALPRDRSRLSAQHSSEFWTVVLDKEEPQKIQMKTTHGLNGNGRQAVLSAGEESDGTKRLMHLAPVLLDSEEDCKVFVIDELDRSMHPLLCRYFLELFFKGVIACKNRGQVIFTTHEPYLLSSDLLRRDEVWFAERDCAGVSHLTSLHEYKVRDDLRLDKGYLQGRFGAIPLLGDPEKALGALWE